MLIYMLATAMTIVMLIATAFGLHQEAARVRVKAALHCTEVRSCSTS